MAHYMVSHQSYEFENNSYEADFPCGLAIVLKIFAFLFLSSDGYHFSFDNPHLMSQEGNTTQKLL